LVRGPIFPLAFKCQLYFFETVETDAVTTAVSDESSIGGDKMANSKSEGQRKERKRGYQVVETDALRKHLGRNDYSAVEELRVMSERIDAINQSKAALSADKRAGFVAEEFIAGTFNRAARKKGQTTLTAKTGSNGGFPLDQRTDIKVTLDGKVVAEAQAKFGANAKRNAVAISKPKYHGTQRIVPSEQASCIRKELAASASRKASSANPRIRQKGADRM